MEVRIVGKSERKKKKRKPGKRKEVTKLKKEK